MKKRVNESSLILARLVAQYLRMEGVSRWRYLAVLVEYEGSFNSEGRWTVSDLTKVQRRKLSRALDEVLADLMSGPGPRRYSGAKLQAKAFKALDLT